ncbi:MAG: phenylalanine--tRNA ligase subunit beta [Acidobacteriota bacterium]|jgi:phenylalanyl-tRNA synthetase beta chain|nr:phenylalanine--tRNA ligase subunit beta [Acidobacteriota bacterium]
MKISYNWLKDLIDIELSPEDLAEKLTLVGLELDGMHETADDFVLDIETTSNRGDCLSHLGVAREISVITDENLKLNDYANSLPTDKYKNLVKIEDADLCHRFTARIIKNVKIGTSPEWLIKRLEAIGERSINNVADITNYVMHELGQPMHAFDFNKLAENRIVVRRAKTGEKITTLDEVERKLDESTLMICDAEKPVAVGGVMGGFDSSITENTTDILLEVAYFDADSIRQTSRKLNLTTEASYHFERGVDIENLIRASNRATELICELAGGTAEDFADVYPTKFIPNEIVAENLKSEVKRLSGLEVEQNKIDRILQNLGIKKLDETTYLSPTWRHDLAIDEDLVEEVVRIVGYDKIGEELPSAGSAGEYQPTENRKKNLRQTLAVLGFDEAISYSFIDEKYDEHFEISSNLIESNTEEKFVSIKDPIIEGATRMRPSLLSGLLEAVRVNFNHQNKNIKLFEIGKVFAKSNSEDGLPKEQELLGFVLTGNEILEQKASSSRQLDFYDLKGAIEASLDAVKLPNLEYKSKDIKHLQSGQSAEVIFNGKSVGNIGKLSGKIASNYKFKQPIYIAEIDLQTLLENAELPAFYKPLPIYPAIIRDISLLIKRNLNFSEIRNLIKNQNFALCRKVEFVDVFEGKGMADDERSMTIRLEYRSDERTLTEDEVEQIHQKILSVLEANPDIKQR